MSDTTIQRGWRYEDHIPYATPDSLDDLRGPLSGLVEVGGHIDTSMRPIYDLADPEHRFVLYARVVRSGTSADQVSLLDRDTLIGLWPSLNLPHRCRQNMARQIPRARSFICQERVMRDFHRRLAEIALRAAESYGFVLAGGYAISSNGMGDRPSADVDLFTNQFQPDKFSEALDAVRRAFRDNQLEINDNFIGPLFADMKITDPRTGESRSRSHPTIRVRTPRRFSH